MKAAFHTNGSIEQKPTTQNICFCALAKKKKKVFSTLKLSLSRTYEFSVILKCCAKAGFNFL